MLLNHKIFWKSTKPLFFQKSSTYNKIKLLEQDLISDKNENVAEVLNNFFHQCSNLSKYHKISR